MGSNIDFKMISLAVVIALIVGAGAGYMVGNSPIPGYKEEIDRLETINLDISEKKAQLLEEYTTLQDQLTEVKEDLSSTQSSVQDLRTEYGELTKDYQSLYDQYEDLKIEYVEYQVSYKLMWDKFDALIQDYNNLTSVTPVGEMIVTEIPGVVNGDFEPREGWLIHGTTGGGPSLPMHQFSRTTYATQTIQINGEDEGIVFSIKPQPLGGTVSFIVKVTDVEGYSDTIIYYEEFSGLNSDFDWIQIVISFKPLFDMKSNYDLEASGAYNLRFSVPAGPDIGSIIHLDNVSLVEISYQPEEGS